MCLTLTRLCSIPERFPVNYSYNQRITEIYSTEIGRSTLYVLASPKRIGISYFPPLSTVPCQLKTIQVGQATG